MSKVYNYMILAVGLTFLLHFAGIPSGADFLLTWLGLSDDAAGYFNSWLYLSLVGTAGLFIVGTGTGIAISFFTKSPSETWVIAPIAAGLFTVLVGTFISIVIYTKTFGFVYYITWMIFIPLLAGFFIAIINFWRGAD